MTQEIVRALVNGVWVTEVASQGGGGGGISEITSDDHTVTVTNPSGPTVDLSASGGSQPVQATYGGSNTITVPDGNAGAVPFDDLVDGTELLDRTTPTAPTFLVAGTYAIFGQVQATAPLTAGGFIVVSAEVNSDAFSGASEGAHPLDSPTQAATMGNYSAGDILHLNVANHDGAASRDFLLFYCRIVKLA